MKKIGYIFFILIALVVLAIPPWNVDWSTDSSTEQNLSMQPDKFVGWHDWTFITEPQSQMIAWDGINTGGKVAFSGNPSSAYTVYSGEILILILMFAGFQYLKRKKKKSS